MYWRQKTTYGAILDLQNDYLILTTKHILSDLKEVCDNRSTGTPCVPYSETCINMSTVLTFCIFMNYVQQPNRGRAASIRTNTVTTCRPYYRQWGQASNRQTQRTARLLTRARSIVLLSALRKTLSVIALSRIAPKVDDYPSSSHTGFRRGRSTVAASTPSVATSS